MFSWRDPRWYTGTASAVLLQWSVKNLDHTPPELIWTELQGSASLSASHMAIIVNLAGSKGHFLLIVLFFRFCFRKHELKNTEAVKVQLGSTYPCEHRRVMSETRHTLSLFWGHHVFTWALVLNVRGCWCSVESCQIVKEWSCIRSHCGVMSYILSINQDSFQNRCYYEIFVSVFFFPT